MSSSPLSISAAAIRRDYQRQGFHLADAVFTPAEVARLCHEVQGGGAFRSSVTVKELSRDRVRSVYGGLDTSELLQRLVADPRLVLPAMELLDGEVYVYQFKVNMKAPFEGDIWPWHQDYAFWAHLDGMPRPDAVTVTLYLDDVTEFNGPMICIPGSHSAGLYPCVDTDAVRLGVDEAVRQGADVSSKLRYTLEPEAVRSLASDYGLFSARAPRGSLFFFHPNLPHASGNNISPLPRRQIFITYNSVKNTLPRPPTRPAYLVNPDTRPVVPRHEALTEA
ncbi:phytanoyl-CoA dioxygenase family protein [Eleftheria terrae]|uniref:phytanoyl-CoA dioxygenase family protein n=1 Tax=Eleftheria terrae TaxID=1597781 RepID=UPI00263AC268|nr:phytanoyl-CoA dioxygenase family protein [Eleftheria terrae]WKB56200.1 phytanoyl-CoA dioxygenase family protein [Eleftheria terrae]